MRFYWFGVTTLVALLGAAPSLMGQDLVHLGMYIDYFRHAGPDEDFTGLGGRLSVGLSEHAQLEGELAYDFERKFAESFLPPGGGEPTFQRSSFRVLHGLFGPKFQSSSGPLRTFLLLKAGFINFRFDDRPATFGTFFSSVQDLRASNVRPVLYPGVGVEGFLGPFGLRWEIADEIYFLDGAHHNLRMTLGPVIRF